MYYLVPIDKSSYGQLHGWYHTIATLRECVGGSSNKEYLHEFIPFAKPTGSSGNGCLNIRYGDMAASVSIYPVNLLRGELTELHIVRFCGGTAAAHRDELQMYRRDDVRR